MKTIVKRTYKELVRLEKQLLEGETNGYYFTHSTDNQKFYKPEEVLAAVVDNPNLIGSKWNKVIPKILIENLIKENNMLYEKLSKYSV